MRISDWSSDVCSSDLAISPPDSLVSREIALGADLSRLLRRQGRQVEAEVEARRALVIALRYFGRFSLPAATTLTNLAAVIYEQGLVDETLNLVDIALGISPTLSARKGPHLVARRSEEPRVGNSCVSTCSFRW